MGRPVKDYWNWTQVVIPQSPNWLPRIQVEKYLDNNFTHEYMITVKKEYPQPRKKYSMKVITEYTYYLKDPKLAFWVELKLG